MRGNTITLNMARWRVEETGNLYQYDYGQRLIISGVKLPASYEVHFSNHDIGVSKTVIGDSTGVDIPDEYLLSGENIHVWVFLHDGTDDGETEYHGIIRVTKRAKPIDVEPTPEQQDVITQTIAALNAGVESVEEIAGEIPQIIDDALTEAKESGEFDGKDGRDGRDGEPGADGFSPVANVTKIGDVSTITITDKDGTTSVEITDGHDGEPGEPGADGFSPTVDVDEITGGHTVTITDAHGYHTFDVMDGERGAQGDPGRDGADGVSPEITVTNITGGHRVTIVDAESTKTVDIMDGSDGVPGQDGADGYSPTITVTNITGGHRVTITDVNGTRTVDVMDGQKGEQGEPGEPGDDGFSPVATVSKSGKTATISITDKNGTTTATVSDGEDGTDIIDDTAGAGDTDKTWSADKIVSEIASAEASLVVPVFAYDATIPGMGCNMTFAEVYSAIQNKRCTYATDEAGLVIYDMTYCAQDHVEFRHVFYSDSSCVGAYAEYYLLDSNNQVETFYESANISSFITINYEYVTASKNYAIGDIFSFNDGLCRTDSTGLYKATAAISQGDTITPGTNCVRTTVEEELAALKEDIADLIDDTAGAGDTDKVWSADKTTTELAAKAPKASPDFTGSISMNRKAGTTVGENSFAVGYDATASGANSLAQGGVTSATGTNSHAEGTGTTASGLYSHSEGNGTTASGEVSHSEGAATTASGLASHTEGVNTVASGAYAHSEGNYTIANHEAQHAAGEYNVSDPSITDSNQRGTYVEIIGNGTASNNRSNARTLDWNGNERLKGDLYVGCNADSSGGTKVATQTDISTLNNAFTQITETHESINLYDKNACNPADGYLYWNGGYTTGEQYATTGKIPVDAETQYIFYAGGKKVQYCEYFSGETGSTFISRAELRDAAFTTPENCTFVAIMLFATSHTTEEYNAAIAAGQLEKGNVVHPYEPYGNSYSVPTNAIEDGDIIENFVTLSEAATSSDVGKALSPKTVQDGVVTEWEYKTIPEGGGGGESVEPQDMAFFDTTVGKNKYNPEDCNPQNNAWYNNTGAVVTDVSTSAVTGKIPIVPGLTYTFSAGGYTIRDYVLFNGDAFISKTDKSGAISATFTAPNNATHVGFNLFHGQNTHTDADYAAAISSSMLELGASATEYEPYTLSYVMPTSYLLDADAVNAAKATLEKRPGINLYDKTLAVDGQYYDNNSGNQAAAANFAISGRIPVFPNTQYCFSADPDSPMGTNYVYEFAQDGSFISAKREGTQRAIPFITGPTTYYVAFNIIAGTSHTTEDFSAIVDALMLTYGACRPTAYSAYAEGYYSTPLNFKYAGVKWISCGTSITWYNAQQYQAGLHTGELCRGYNGLIADETGILLTNDGISGATLANISSSSFINRYNSIDWTDYDVATIEFAVNDNGHNVDLGSTSAAANTTDFCGCLKTVIEYILGQNPTIILILCTDPDVRTLSPNTAGYTLKDYCDAIKTIADLYRLPVCDWYYRSGINPTTKGGESLDYLTADGTHPSDKGHERMAKLLLQTMESMM